MNEQLHRTPEWDRLKGSGFFQVEDRPGQIALGRASPYEKKMDNLMLFAVGFPAALVVVGLMMGGIWGAFGAALPAALFFGITYFISIQPGKAFARSCADMVIFTPHAVYFRRGTENLGQLPREAMQQIVPDQDKQLVRSHKFLSDVGYIWAFVGSGENEHLLMNNILMAAFKQPVHLDLMDQAPSPASVMDMTAAPQISGL